MSLIHENQSLTIVSEKPSNKLDIYQNEKNILFFQGLLQEGLDSVCFYLDEKHPLYQSVYDLYQKVLCKYFIDSREHSRRYCFGKYGIVTPPENDDTINRTITWYSLDTFNEFHCDDFPKTIQEQSFGIQKLDNGFLIKFKNERPNVDFIILPNNLCGNYRPFLSRNSHDFFSDLEHFYHINKSKKYTLKYIRANHS